MTVQPISQRFPARLLTVLQAALRAPGNWARFQAAGLLQTGSTATFPTLVDHWPERFIHLPPLEKATVRRTPGQYLAGVDDIVYRGATSGSRSRSYTFFANTAWNQRRQQSRQAFLAWWGIDQNTPIVNVASRLMPGRAGDWAIVGPWHPDCLASLLGLLARQPSVLRGYPSRLCEVASLLPPLPLVKAVICTGEPLFQHQRSLLTTVFQAPVINEYGCHEAGVRGFACPEFGRIHLDTQSCFFEIIDGALVTTDLWNEAMPLVRYRCGDCVRPLTTSCSCGRPGPTVEILGRIEDRIGTRQGLKMLGEVDLPALPQILHYRIQRQSPTQVSAQIQSPGQAPTQRTPLGETALQRWVDKTFGHSQLHITYHATQTNPDDDRAGWSDHQWLDTITQTSLGAWLSTAAMPMGEARPLAQLLRELLMPHVIGADVPETTRQIWALAHSTAAANPEVEKMKIRILLLAGSCISDRSTAQAIYAQALARQQTLSPDQAAALQLDSLIATLPLPTELAVAAWQRQAIATPCQLDSLHVQHLLAAFERALQPRSSAVRPPILRQLQPPLAMLIGDLSFWAADLRLAHLHHWAELLHGTPIPPAPIAQTADVPAFTAAWLAERRALLAEPHRTAAPLTALQSAATSTAEQARLAIEQGYAAIARQQPLSPQQWLPLIETYAADLTATPASSADLTPWLPIVKALVAPLHQQGEADLAYRCLLAMSTPSRQQSAFERLTAQFNQKQSVLVDLCPQQRQVS